MDSTSKAKIASGQISVAPYEDGSGDRVTVKFDRSGGETGQGNITIEQFSDGAIWIDYEHIGEFLEAVARAYIELGPDRPTKTGEE